MLAALERTLERERPGFRVTWAAVSASAAARGVRFDLSAESHLPGNRETFDDQAPGPVPTYPAPVVPPALPGWGLLAPCGGCGGATRVAVIDLARESATVECVACGLRRRDRSVAPEVLET